MKHARFLALALLVAAFCLLPFVAQARTIGSWTPIYDGICAATGSDTVPQLMAVYVLRIDLQNPNVEFFATPKTAADPYHTYLQQTAAFMSEYGLQVAINTNFFNATQNPTVLIGAEVSQGNLVAGGNSTCPGQLRITSDNVASIVYTTSTPVGYWTVSGGYQALLTNGTKITDTSSVAPRSCCGLSQDGRYVYLMVCDGRQTGYSDGATLHDMADWLADFGAYNGMNFDGGGSATICREDVGGTWNSPSMNPDRSVGASLGVWAPPVPEIIVDNPEGSWSANWTLGTMSADKYGADYRYRSTAAVSDRFTWTPNITSAGNYEVYAWWPQGGNRSPNAPYTVYYNGGSQLVYVNQQANGGMWNSLGTYNFAAGTTGNVKLSCWTTTGYVVVADAIKLVKRP